MAGKQQKKETDSSETPTTDTMTERELRDMLSKGVKRTDSEERLNQFVRWRIQEYTLHKWNDYLSDIFAEEFTQQQPFQHFVKEDFEKLSKDNIRALRDCLRTNGVYVQKGRKISIAQALANAVKEDIPWPSDDEERPPPKQSQSYPPQQQPVQPQQPYQPIVEDTTPIHPPPTPSDGPPHQPQQQPMQQQQPEDTTPPLPPPITNYDPSKHSSAKPTPKETPKSTSQTTSPRGKSIAPPKSGLSALLPAETPAVEAEFSTPTCPATPPPEYRSTTPPPVYQSSTPKNYLTVADLYMRYAPLKSAKSSWIRPVVTRSRTVLPILTVKDLYEKFHGKPKKNPAISTVKWTPASPLKYPKSNAATPFPGQKSTAGTPVPTKHKTLVNICLDSARPDSTRPKVMLLSSRALRRLTRLGEKTLIKKDPPSPHCY